MSIACTGCGGHVIPLVPIGTFKGKGERFKRGKPDFGPISIGIADPSVARMGVMLFLRSKVGQETIRAIVRGLGLTAQLPSTGEVVERPVSPDKLMREIEEFLRRQRQSRGAPVTGVAVPIPQKKRRNPLAPHTAPEVKEGLQTLMHSIIPTERETDDEDDRAVKRWFERRWHKSPGLAFALGMDNRGFGGAIRPQRPKNGRKGKKRGKRKTS